jgi:hypothetical protein
MLLLPELLFLLLVEVLSLLIALQLLLVCRLVLLFLLGLLLCCWNCYLAGDASWQGRGVLFLPPGLPLYSVRWLLLPCKSKGGGSVQEKSKSLSPLRVSKTSLDQAPVVKHS